MCGHVWHIGNLHREGWLVFLLPRIFPENVLFGRDDLIHICAQSRVQTGALHLTYLSQSFVLSFCLWQHLSVYCIWDLTRQKTDNKQTSKKSQQIYTYMYKLFP